MICYAGLSYNLPRESNTGQTSLQQYAREADPAPDQTRIGHGQPDTIRFKAKDDVMIATEPRRQTARQALRFVSSSHCKTSVSLPSNTRPSGCIRPKRDSVCGAASASTNTLTLLSGLGFLAINHDSGTNLAHCALSIIFVRPAGPTPHHASGTC